VKAPLTTNEGGGRKGLPKSFLNRFTKVFINKLLSEDLLFIATAIYPNIPSDLLQKMISFNEQLHHDTMVACKYGRKGSPWEFNLRDVFRWCSLMEASQNTESWNPGKFLDLIYLQRMRTQEDRQEVLKLYRRIFGGKSASEVFHQAYYNITPQNLQIGYSSLARNTNLLVSDSNDTQRAQLLPHQLRPLEHVMKCVEMNWMTILIGASGSGKTTMIRALARLTGHTLNEFAMNSSVDTTEILGGFEQIDLSRARESLVADIKNLVNHTTSLAILHDQGARDVLLSKLQVSLYY